MSPHQPKSPPAETQIPPIENFLATVLHAATMDLPSVQSGSFMPDMVQWQAGGVIPPGFCRKMDGVERHTQKAATAV